MWQRCAQHSGCVRPTGSVAYLERGTRPGDDRRRGGDTGAAPPVRHLRHSHASDSSKASLPGNAETSRQAAMTDVPYAELHAHSYYSFADGADSPADLVTEAAADHGIATVRCRTQPQLDGASPRPSRSCRGTPGRPRARPCRVRAPVSGDHRGKARRRRERPAEIRPRRTRRRGAGRALADPHRRPQRPASSGTGRGRLG